MRDSKRRAEDAAGPGDAPCGRSGADRRSRGTWRGFVSLKRSPLARRIIAANLVAQIVLISGVLYLNPARDSLLSLRESGMVAETNLIADMFEAQIRRNDPLDPLAGNGLDLDAMLNGLELAQGAEVFVFDTAGNLVGHARGLVRTDWPVEEYEGDSWITVITDALYRAWLGGVSLFGQEEGSDAEGDPQRRLTDQVAITLTDGQQVATGVDSSGHTTFSVTAQILRDRQVVGVVAMVSASGEIDRLVRIQREQVLQV
ncbi:sensor N-terminal transmembrane domain-containing protein, partial [Rhodovulum sulfidophilum]|nr:sensor N-terminal transmembrane domain-containing protein [Rhodovulum sulfidophilum]